MRETKFFTTPVGKNKIEVKTYITGREKRAIVGAYLNKGLDYNAGTEDIKGINASVVDDAQNITINTIIVSVDGNKNGDIVADKSFSVVDAVLDMHATDFDFIINELNEVTKDKDFEQKKTT